MGRSDIERPSRQHREAESGRVEDLDEVGAALDAFDQFGLACAGQLRHIADQVQEFAAGVVASE